MRSVLAAVSRTRGTDWCVVDARTPPPPQEQMSSLLFFIHNLPMLAVLLLRYRLYPPWLKAGASIFVVRAVVECAQCIAASAGPVTLSILPSPPRISNILTGHLMIPAVSGELKSGAPLCGAKILGFRAAARPKILVKGGREGSKICLPHYVRGLLNLKFVGLGLVHLCPSCSCNG